MTADKLMLFSFVFLVAAVVFLVIAIILYFRFHISKICDLIMRNKRKRKPKNKEKKEQNPTVLLTMEQEELLDKQDTLLLTNENGKMTILQDINSTCQIH